MSLRGVIFSHGTAELSRLMRGRRTKGLESRLGRSRRGWWLKIAIDTMRAMGGGGGGLLFSFANNEA